MLEDYGLDGLDVDYEYPQNDEQAWGYVNLLQELRQALDEHARNKQAQYRFLLTVRYISFPLLELLLTGYYRSLLLVAQTTIASCISQKWTNSWTSGIS